MRVSGFTFVRNGIELTYPFRESIQSLLPLVDELIVNVPESTDATLEAIKAIDSGKLSVFESSWDESLREGGEILALQTNRALERCSGDWAVYLQADEVLHEDDLPGIRATLEQNLEQSSVDALSFRYLHFEGGYWQVNPFRYRRQVRVIRNNDRIRSIGDACGFGRKDGAGIRAVKTPYRVFHYGWARDPREMLRKNRELEKLYHDDEYIRQKYDGMEEHAFRELEVCRPFRGKHPGVMREVVESSPAEVLIPNQNRPYFLRGRVWRMLFKKWGLMP